MIKVLNDAFRQWYTAIEQRIEVGQYTVATIYAMVGVAVAFAVLIIIVNILASLPSWLNIFVFATAMFFGIRHILADYGKRQYPVEDSTPEADDDEPPTFVG